MILKNNKELKRKDFKNEKELQTYFEQNLKRILNCDFIETEFTVGNFRIDTLAFDEENNASMAEMELSKNQLTNKTQNEIIINERGAYP